MKKFLKENIGRVCTVHIKLKFTVSRGGLHDCLLKGFIPYTKTFRMVDRLDTDIVSITLSYQISRNFLEAMPIVEPRK